MKYKSIKWIPQWDSYKGLHYNDWQRLNNGKIVELEKVPELAEEYLQKVVKQKKKEDE